LAGNTAEWQEHTEQNPFNYLNIKWLYDGGWITTVMNFEALKTVNKAALSTVRHKEICFHTLFLICD
jgi:hypothetical protein